MGWARVKFDLEADRFTRVPGYVYTCTCWRTRGREHLPVRAKRGMFRPASRVGEYNTVWNTRLQSQVGEYNTVLKASARTRSGQLRCRTSLWACVANSKMRPLAPIPRRSTNLEQVVVRVPGYPGTRVPGYPGPLSKWVSLQAVAQHRGPSDRRFNSSWGAARSIYPGASRARAYNNHAHSSKQDPSMTLLGPCGRTLWAQRVAAPATDL
eukprot:491678-Rhodomonas_salina.1